MGVQERKFLSFHNYIEKSLYLSVSSYDNHMITYRMLIYISIWIKIYKVSYYILSIERNTENIECNILRVKESEDEW